MECRTENKKYTLEEAYQEIVKIRKAMGYDEFKSNEERVAYERGYQQAIIDLETEVRNRSQLLLAVNITKQNRL